jgi:hypothetical protein
MEQPVYQSFRETAEAVINALNRGYWEPIYQYLQANPHLVNIVPGFLVSPEELILYFGKTHLGIEYTGVERLESLPERGEINVKIFDYTKSKDNYLEQIIGFEYTDSTINFSFPLTGMMEDLIIPTNRGFDKLAELNWHFEAQDSIMVFNVGTPALIENQFTRFINGLFFDANENGLRTRHIKWMDFIPVVYDETLDEENDLYAFDLSPYANLVEHDCHYIYPLPENFDYRHSKLQKINRLIQLVGNNETKETDITQFLSHPDNQFILTMRFGALSIASETTCHWQSAEKPPIRPDFFIVQTNGFADIVEFKLPSAEVEIVGRENRESFSAQINSYISQTRTYRNYFDDPNNRAWFEQMYNFKVYKPRRILVIGRRWQFETETWKEIVSDYQDLEILTYDDLVDGVVAQLYM